MAKKRNRDAAAAPAVAQPQAEAFTFGDPVPVMDQRELLGYLGSSWNGRYYEPPVSFDALAKSLHANPHHESAIHHKVNQLVASFVPSRWLTRQGFHRLALDYVVFGNAWVERRNNRLGKLLDLAPTMARWTRAKKDGDALMLIDGQEHHFEPGAVFQFLAPDVSQEIYGMPGYLGAMQSVFLNEAATLFRRRYYVNGSHAGFILYVSDPAQNPKDIDAMREALRSSKGIGNFRNLFYYSPNGKGDGVKLIPISEVAAKDEFLHIKGITRDDVLAAHRTPPQLLGIIPNNAGGFGSISEAKAVFHQSEVQPIQTVMLDLNAWAGEEVIRFSEVIKPAA